MLFLSRKCMHLNPSNIIEIINLSTRNDPLSRKLYTREYLGGKFVVVIEKVQGKVKCMGKYMWEMKITEYNTRSLIFSAQSHISTRVKIKKSEDSGTSIGMRKLRYWLQYLAPLASLHYFIPAREKQLVQNFLSKSKSPRGQQYPIGGLLMMDQHSQCKHLFCWRTLLEKPLSASAFK